MTPILLDTGAIVALLDRSEAAHERCVETLRKIPGPLVTCEPAIAKSCYLLRNLPGASEAVIANVTAGIFQIPFQLSRQSEAVRSILKKYRDRAIDLADACLIRVAEEFATEDLLTLDKNLTVYRWAGIRLFTYCPDRASQFANATNTDILWARPRAVRAHRSRAN